MIHTLTTRTTTIRPNTKGLRILRQERNVDPNEKVVLYECIIVCRKSKLSALNDVMQLHIEKGALEELPSEFSKVFDCFGTTSSAKDEIREIFGRRDYFSTPKPEGIESSFWCAIPKATSAGTWHIKESPPRQRGMDIVLVSRLIVPKTSGASSEFDRRMIFKKDQYTELKENSKSGTIVSEIVAFLKTCDGGYA